MCSFQISLFLHLLLIKIATFILSKKRWEEAWEVWPLHFTTISKRQPLVCCLVRVKWCFLRLAPNWRAPLPGKGSKGLLSGFISWLLWLSVPDGKRPVQVIDLARVYKMPFLLLFWRFTTQVKSILGLNVRTFHSASPKLIIFHYALPISFKLVSKQFLSKLYALLLLFSYSKWLIKSLSIVALFLINSCTFVYKI